MENLFTMSLPTFEISDKITSSAILRSVLIVFSVSMIALIIFGKRSQDGKKGFLPPSVSLLRAAWLWYRSGLPIYEFSRQLKYSLNSNVYMINVFGQNVVFLADFYSIREAFTNPHLLARPRVITGPATPDAMLDYNTG